MIARIAYLTSPDAGRYVVNYQPFGTDELVSVELSSDQLRNILVSGVSLMLSPVRTAIKSQAGVAAHD